MVAPSWWNHQSGGDYRRTVIKKRSYEMASAGVTLENITVRNVRSPREIINYLS